MGVQGLPQLNANPFAAGTPGVASPGVSGLSGANAFGVQSPVFGGQSLGGAQSPFGQQMGADPLAQMGLQSMTPDTQQLFMTITTMMVGVMTLIAGVLAGILSGAISGKAPPGAAGSSPVAANASAGSTPSSGGDGSTSGTTPASSGGGVTQLSKNKDERMKQLVAEAARVFPGDPVRQKLAVTQALLESGSGDSMSSLALEHNNLFGIKGKGTAGTVNMGTKEQGSNGLYSTNAGFAKNNTVAESFEQYKKLLGNDRYKKVLSAGSFEQAATEVRAAGYATDNAYVSKLLSVYNQHVAKYF